MIEQRGYEVVKYCNEVFPYKPRAGTVPNVDVLEYSKPINSLVGKEGTCSPWNDGVVPTMTGRGTFVIRWGVMSTNRPRIRISFHIMVFGRC
jgi:hypothetical protein